MKDQEIIATVKNVKQCLNDLNNQLATLASQGVTAGFAFERDPSTNAVKILLTTCTEIIDYTKEQ